MSSFGNALRRAAVVTFVALVASFALAAYSASAQQPPAPAPLNPTGPNQAAVVPASGIGRGALGKSFPAEFSGRGVNMNARNTWTKYVLACVLALGLGSLAWTAQENDTKMKGGKSMTVTG